MVENQTRIGTPHIFFSWVVPSYEDDMLYICGNSQTEKNTKNKKKTTFRGEENTEENSEAVKQTYVLQNFVLQVNS
jgi:hypothetical protein